MKDAIKMRPNLGTQHGSEHIANPTCRSLGCQPASGRLARRQKGESKMAKNTKKEEHTREFALEQFRKLPAVGLDALPVSDSDEN